MATNAKGPIIGINALAYYIKRIITFLESDKKTLSCPNISQQLQDVLVKISTEGAEFLKSDEYTIHVKIEAARLAAAIKTHANVKLTHEISDGKLGLNVFMYKKMEVDIFKVPEPLRVPSVVKPVSAMEPPSDGSMTQIFKTNCLNAATKFVKDDSQLVLRFPEMHNGQAEFVMAMLLPGKEGKSEKTDIGFGYRSMYAPLWESMKVFSLKYDYNIEYGTKPVSKDGMKRVVFEKIPKCKVIETIDLTSEETPEAIIDTDFEEILDDSSSTSSSSITSKSYKVSMSNRKISKTEANKPKTKRKIEKLIRKLHLRMQKGLIAKKVVRDALCRISEFLLDDQQKSIVFEETSPHHQYFLSNVKRLSAHTATYMLFDAECQRFLDNIKYCLNKRKVQYDVIFMKGIVKTFNKANNKVTSSKSLLFEKKLPKATDAELEPLNSSSSSKSATSLTASAETQKLKQSKNQQQIVTSKKKLEVAAQIEGKLSKGFLNEEFIETTLQSISDFMLDEQQASIVFKPRNFHHLHFIQKVGYLARTEATYKVFSYESQKLLASINCCFKSNILYQVRQFKKRQDVILEKLANFNSNNGRRSSLSLGSTISVSTSASASDSAASLKQPSQTKVNKQAEKAMEKLNKKMRFGILTNDFIETTLQRICDFMYNEQPNIRFQDVSGDHFHFIKHVEYIARHQTWHCVFRTPSQKLLADLNRCFERNMLYKVKQIKGQGWKDLVLEKLASLPTKKLIKEKENNENVNNSNIPSAPMHPTTPISQSEQDLLIRLKAIKETIERTCGDQAIIHYLQDVSSFLTHSNTDRVLTFDDVSENEAVFLKHVHALSKLEAGYAMFSRNSQKLLKSIRLNAQTHKLNFKMILENESRGLWTVIIKKLYISANENKEVHRARSLSAGRRRQQSASNAKTEMTSRGASTQRHGVLEKLIAGLAQPVQSDKALRMMESMGWRGGALGIRGEGITEPIALPLDLATRAGFGHVPTPKKQKPKPKKLKPFKQGAPKPPTLSPEGTQPVNSLPSDVIPPGILPTGLVEKVTKTVVLNNNYHVPVLRSILEIITTDVDVVHFTCEKNPQKSTGFLKHAVAAFNGRYRFELDNEVQRQLVAEISHTFDSSRDIKLSVEVRKKTDLNPRIVVVKKSRKIEVISLIDDEPETTNEQEPTTDNQESTMIWYQKPTTSDQLLTTNDQLLTTNDQLLTTINKYSTTSWYQIKQSTSGRRWYYPIKSKRQHQLKTETEELKTRKNQVPELKTLALFAINYPESIETDVEIPGATSIDQNKTDGLSCLSIQSDNNSSVQQGNLKAHEVKTTNMTGLLFSTNNQQGGTKNSLKTYPSAPKKRKITNNQGLTTNTQGQQDITEIKKPPGVVLLEKFTINNNDSMTNKNAPVVKTAKSLVSVRLQNSVADSNVTVNKENESVNIAPTINNSASNIHNVVPNINNSAPNINNVAPIANKRDPTTSALSDTDLICSKRTTHKKQIDDNKALSNNSIDVTQTVTYIIPVKSEMYVESYPKDKITDTIQNDRGFGIIQNNSDLKENINKHTSITNSVSKNDKVCECQTVFEEARSKIVINSDKEKVTIYEEYKFNKPTNNLTEEKEKDTIKELTKEKDTIKELTKEKDTIKDSLNEKDTSRKVIKPKGSSKTVLQEIATNYTEKGLDNNDDSEDPVLEREDTQPVLIQERKRPLFDYRKSLPKKSKITTDFKKIYILPKNYPQTKINNEKAREIQSAILKSIDYTQESLPFLKCQGIQNGGLIYSCQDENSVFFLENLIQNRDDLKIVYGFDVEEQLSHKMAFRINSYIAEPVVNVLNRLELYNTGLNSTKWGVLKMEQYSDFAVICVEVDDVSFNYICEANFILYAGNDCARFTILWD